MDEHGSAKDGASAPSPSKRRWNSSLWIGTLGLALLAVAYIPMVERFPFVANTPSLFLVLLAAASALIAHGAIRAFRQPALYRGKIAGSLFVTMGVAMVALYAFSLYHVARQVPASAGAPKVGEMAPHFELPSTEGRPLSLSNLLGTGRPGGGNAAVLIFYRGYW